MAQLDPSINLYELNKQVMGQFKRLGKADIELHMNNISSWFALTNDTYFMLLCHDLRDYTLFHFTGEKITTYEASQELLETLQNRGTIVEIGFEEEDNAFAIWIKNKEGESNLYFLFPYDTGVIEI